MELLDGDGKQMKNAAIKALQCECGHKVFQMFPKATVHYNALNPLEAMPNVVGMEFQCEACQKWAALNRKVPGQLPKWYFMTPEEREAARPVPHPENRPEA